jgi:hypothetical protein
VTGGAEGDGWLDGVVDEVMEEVLAVAGFFGEVGGGRDAYPWCGVGRWHGWRV